MSKSDKYWLSLLKEYTDLAVIPEDRGMHKDAIPPSVVKGLGDRVKRVGDRITISAAGRKFLKGEE